MSDPPHTAIPNDSTLSITLVKKRSMISDLTLYSHSFLRRKILLFPFETSLVVLAHRVGSFADQCAKVWILSDYFHLTSIDNYRFNSDVSLLKVNNLFLGFLGV